MSTGRNRPSANRASLGALAVSVAVLAGCATSAIESYQPSASTASRGRTPAEERIIQGVAEVALTDRAWPTFDAAQSNRINAVVDGAPLFAHIRATRPLLDLAHPGDPNAQAEYARHPHLFLQVGDTDSMRILNTCYVTMTPEEGRAQELVVPLAPMVRRPGGIPTDCWLATVASQRSPKLQQEVRLAGFAGKFERWLPVPDILAVAPIDADLSTGSASYAAMLRAPAEQRPLTVARPAGSNLGTPSDRPASPGSALGPAAGSGTGASSGAASGASSGASLGPSSAAGANPGSAAGTASGPRAASPGGSSGSPIRETVTPVPSQSPTAIGAAAAGAAAAGAATVGAAAGSGATSSGASGIGATSGAAASGAGAAAGVAGSSAPISVARPSQAPLPPPSSTVQLSPPPPAPTPVAPPPSTLQSAPVPTVTAPTPRPQAGAPVAVATPVSPGRMAPTTTAEPVPGRSAALAGERLEAQLQALATALLGRRPSEAYFTDDRWASAVDQRGQVFAEQAFAAAVFRGSTCSWARLRVLRRPGSANIADIERAGEVRDVSCADLR